MGASPSHSAPPPPCADPRFSQTQFDENTGSVSGVEVEADPAPEAECATTPGDYGEPPTRCPYKKVKRFVKRTIADLVSKMVMLLPHSGNTGS